jgi:L-fucose mutarotase
MSKYRLIHPEILEAVAAAGHGATILIADGNYPATTHIGDNASIVYLNLTPGVPTVNQVLETILSAIPIEEAAVMAPDTGEDPPAFGEFLKILPEMDLVRCSRFEFYEEAESGDTTLVVVTGDQRPYTNILLTVGVRDPGEINY